MLPCYMLSSQSSPSPSPSPDFSYLCARSVSAFNSLPLRCHPERSEGSAFLCPCTLSLDWHKRSRPSPFPATLTNPLQITENKTTLSLVFVTLTNRVKSNPFVCHSYKKRRGWGWHRLQSVRCLVFTTHHSLLATHYSFFPNGNKLGSAGGESAIASNSGYFTRSGSGTFTLERFNMLMSWRALTTPLPW